MIRLYLPCKASVKYGWIVPVGRFCRNICQGKRPAVAKIIPGDDMENNLKAHREAAGLSQQQVADIFMKKYGMSTITREHISQWERRIKTPSLLNALILAQIYNCKVENLFSLV